MCYNVGMKHLLMNRHDRMTYGEQNFERYVLPLVQNKFPGVWHSCNALPLDYEHGIDYVVINGAHMTTISARIWMGMPRQWFSLRWKRTSDPFRKLELQSRLDAYLHNGMLSDWTIEGFHLNGESYIAMVPTIKLMEVVANHFESLNIFMINNNNKDHTIFKRVGFYDFGMDEVVQKVIARI